MNTKVTRAKFIKKVLAGKRARIKRRNKAVLKRYNQVAKEEKRQMIHGEFLREF